MTYVPPDQPMTRRERRLLEEQGGPAPVSAPATSELLASTDQVPVSQELITPSAPLSRRERRALEHSEQGGAEPLVPTGSTPLSQPVPTQAPLPPVFGLPVPQAQANTGATTIHPPATQPVASPPAASQPVPMVSNPLDTAPTPAPTLSRTVGDVSTATSSLILPGTPVVDMTSPLSSTGEVVVTGQITLPPRLAEQGTTPVLDSSGDNDEVMDAYVTGELAAMSKPVRASQAVSGKGDDTDILLVRKARWGTATIVTALVAAVLGLAAVGLLLLALLTDVMG